MASKTDLSAMSDFFTAQFNKEMRENREGIIRLENVTETVMRVVLEFIRTGSVEITPGNFEDLIEATDFLLIPSLSTYHFAKSYQCEDLLFISKRFILSNFTGCG